MEKTLTKDILKNKMSSGEEPVMQLLYARYGGMLYSYLLQFVPERNKAEELLVDIFCRLALRLPEVYDSKLSVYCWMQVEARKIILEYTHPEPRVVRMSEGILSIDSRQESSYYFSLLEEASPEQQWVFRELFLYGRQRGDLAVQAGKDLAYIGRLLRECLLMIRKKLG